MRSPQEIHEAMVREVSDGVKNAFPITHGEKSLELIEFHHDEMPHPEDYNGQKSAVMSGKTWGVPIRASLALKHGDQVVDHKIVRLGLMPTPTNRHTFIINGKEYAVAHQRRLRPGLYTKTNRLGEPVADFNLGRGRNFSVVLDPSENRFDMKYANTHIPLHTVLKHVYGVNGIGLGKEFDREQTPEEALSTLKTLHAETHKNKPIPENVDELKEALRAHFNQATSMDPQVNQMTVGHGHETVSALALQDAAKHVLEIHKGKRLPTGKDQMAFTEVHGIEDFMGERLRKNKYLIANKLKWKLDKAKSLDDLSPQAAIHPLLNGFFSESSLSNNPIQVNPLEMKENAFKITSMGEGGISDANSVPNEVRNIHPSTAGFIDPVRTPDNAKAGVDVRTTLGTKKIGKQLAGIVKNLKTDKHELKTPADLYDKVVAHDQEHADEHGMVRAIHRGQVVDVTPDKVEYHIPTEHQWTVSTAIVPFIPNSHAHRVAMGAKMLGQALSLVDREAPIVDTLHSDKATDFTVPKSPVHGTIAKVEPGVVHVREAGTNRLHKVHYAHEFPLNGGSYLHTDIGVKAGDKVAQGQALGDSNFTKGGRMALGKNLEVAYIPFKGLNYEDGIVVTESGAAKLVSHHLHTEKVDIDERSVHDKQKFMAHFPGKHGKDVLAKLDEHGVVQVGQTVREGEPLIARLRKKSMSPEKLMLGKAHKDLANPMSDASITWDKPYDGRVTAVAKTGSGIKVTVVSKAPLQVGDKLAGRFGNKGVVTAIVPDHHAPKTADGRIPDVMLNPAGIISRMNPGQIYEVAAGKALRAMGRSGEKMPQFTGTNTHTLVKNLVAKSGVSESEEMFDPESGKSTGKVLMGPMYMLKLFKQAETGYSARSGGSQYDIDLRPGKGGEEGAKSVGHLDMFGFLAHGAKNILRESSTYKAEYNPEVFHSMWTGKPLPAPKPTFAYNKFESMLKGMGVNVKKDGARISIMPMTDKDVLAMSAGQITRPHTVNEKVDPHTGLPFRPEEGGLFDHHTTGGLLGNKWSHITLHEPVVNPLYKKPARIVLGMNKAEFDDVIANEGGHGIKRRLAVIDPASHLSLIKSQLAQTNSVSKRDELHKRAKYLAGLQRNGLTPDEAYVIHHVPVVPPNVRPIYPDADTGKIVNSDANRLYQNLMLVNDQLKHHEASGDPETAKELRHALHHSVAAVQGLDGHAEEMGKDQAPQGFLKIITGNRAKEGFFQSKLISRRQDVAGRGVVVPNPKLGLDDIGIPEPMAWKLYRHHATGELVKSGLPLNVAADEIVNQSSRAKKALQIVMGQHPMIISRAPSLHKFNVQAFKPQLVGGKSIEVNTLIHKGFNMDHDGDAVNVHVPLGHEAAQDAFRMMPSNNLFSPLNRAPVNVPTQESIMGLWKATTVRPGSQPVRSFATKADALAAYKRGEINVHDPIEVHQ